MNKEKFVVFAKRMIPVIEEVENALKVYGVDGYAFLSINRDGYVELKASDCESRLIRCLKDGDFEVETREKL